MRGTMLYGTRDIRFEDRETPRIEQPTDAVIRMAATCVFTRCPDVIGGSHEQT